MNEENFLHIETVVARRIAVAMLLGCCLLFMTACQDAQVKGEYSNPYTLTQVKQMMAYHGALVARFDGKQWWFLSGKRWVKLEAGGAHEYALLAERKDTPL